MPGMSSGRCDSPHLPPLTPIFKHRGLCTSPIGRETGPEKDSSKRVTEWRPGCRIPDLSHALCPMPHCGLAQEGPGSWAAHQQAFVGTYILGSGHCLAGPLELDEGRHLTLHPANLGQRPEPQAWGPKPLTRCLWGGRGGRALAEKGREPEFSIRPPVGQQIPAWP